MGPPPRGVNENRSAPPDDFGVGAPYENDEYGQYGDPYIYFGGPGL